MGASSEIAELRGVGTLVWGYHQYRGDTISRLEDVQYCNGISSVLRRVFSNEEDIQCYGGTINTLGDAQYCGSYHHYC